MKLEQREIDEIYEAIRRSFNVYRGRYVSRYMILHRVVLHFRGNPKLQKIVKAARDSKRDSVLSETDGVKTVTSIFDTIEWIEAHEPRGVKDHISELKETVFVMQRLADDARAVSNKSEDISLALDKICQYIEGTRETIEDQPVQGLRV